MRYVIFGAGAVGGAIGGRLARAGREVVLIARGAHLERLRRDGLELRDPEGAERLTIPAVGSPAEAEVRSGDCVILATKTQQSQVALDELRAVPGSNGGHGVAVVCAQNGVENERLTLRLFDRTYGMRVVVAATHLEPGVVEIATAPVYGLLDVGRYPAGSDDLAERLVADLVSAGFDAQATPEVMAFKYLKLLSNLGNALQAASGTELSGEPARSLLEAARVEALRCYELAGITIADDGADHSRREALGKLRPVAGGSRRAGGSSWQSLQRGTGNIEADYLNGEIVLLGRIHNVPTPVNARLQEVANELARERRAPGSLPLEQVASGLEL